MTFSDDCMLQNWYYKPSFIFETKKYLACKVQYIFEQHCLVGDLAVPELVFATTFCQLSITNIVRVFRKVKTKKGTEK